MLLVVGDGATIAQQSVSATPNGRPAEQMDLVVEHHPLSGPGGSQGISAGQPAAESTATCVPLGVVLESLLVGHRAVLALRPCWQPAWNLMLRARSTLALASARSISARSASASMNQASSSVLAP